jgi:hypothetical protein
MNTQAMNEATFWSLLAKARKRGATSACDCCLTRYLKKLSDEEVSDFVLMLYEKVCDLNNWRVWGAGEVITPYMSGDSFHYFRTWIVGVGKKAFEAALKDPDSLGPFIDDSEGEINIDNEALEYVAVKILQERGVKIDPRDRCGRNADDEPSGEPFEIESVAASFPKLAAQFRKNGETK